MFFATVQKFFCLLLLIHVMVTNFAQHTKACDVIKECVNNTTCIATYADVYSALASPKNYFNIALALYPARKPSSVLVYVNLHTFNQTGKSSAACPYTWSMSCLYAALPAKVLELLSLGSILVTSRERELNITIAPFCCNVSEDDRFIMIDRVLAEVSYKQFYYTTQAVRGPITKNQPIKMLYCLSNILQVLDRVSSRMIPHLRLCSLCFLQSCNKSLINQACSGLY